MLRLARARDRPSIEGVTSPANVLLLIHLWLLVARRIGISVRVFAVRVTRLTPRPPHRCIWIASATLQGSEATKHMSQPRHSSQLGLIMGISFSWGLTLKILVPGRRRLLSLSNLWWKDMGSYTREK
jgi:hypothetical protein